MNRCLIVGLAIAGLPVGRVCADEKAPSYIKEVRPFLDKYCIQCHKTGMAKGGANLESYESIMKGGKGGRKLLVAGKPDESRLVTCTEGTAKPVMPPKKAKAKPSEKETAVLRDWVKAGAKDDTPKDAEVKDVSRKGAKTPSKDGEVVLVTSPLCGFAPLREISSKRDQ
jgi:mono/diheme cytochrome c family protein